MGWIPTQPHLLVVDDDPLFGRVLTELTSAAPLEARVTVACSLAEARAQVLDRAPDAVLLDVCLPDGTGFDLCRELAERSTMPVVVITGSDPTAVWVEAAAAGATTLLNKDQLEASRLIGALAFAFETSAAQRATRRVAELLADGATDDEGLLALLDSLRRDLALEGAGLSLVRPDGSSALSTQVGRSEGEPDHRVARSLHGWGVEMTMWAADRRWERVDGALALVAEVLLAHRRLEDGLNQLAESESRYRSVSNATLDLILTVDEHGVVTAANQAAVAVMGDLVGGHLLASPTGRAVAQLAATLVARVRTDGESVVVDDQPLDGATDTSDERRWFSGRALNGEGGLVHVVLSDSTDRVLTENELSTMALSDPLTGLANRRLALDRLQHALDQLGRRQGLVMLATLDIDHFKAINDIHGHATGDDALIAVGHRLRSAAREADTVARMGGDEFLIVAEGVSDHRSAARVAERFREAVAGPLAARGHSVDLHCSLGFVIVDQAGMSADEALSQADQALYSAKRQGRDCSAAYQQAERVFGSNAGAGRALRSALENDRFLLRYQPIRVGGQMVAVEALLRMVHPVHGELEPVEFIDALLDSPLLAPVGRLVVSEALDRLAGWLMDGLVDEDFRVHVNIAPHQIGDSAFVDHVLDEMTRTGVPAGSLVLEVTEQSLLDLRQRSSGLLRLSEAGVGVYLDDFGTGASSISHLRSPALIGLKIDRSFVAGDAERTPRDQGIVEGIVALAASLGLDVIVEGVEHLDQLARFAAYPGIGIQGFVNDRPLLPDELEERLGVRGPVDLTS